MANDATEIRAGLGAGVWIAPVATAFPSGVADPGGSWTLLGYVTEDGVTFSTQPEFRDQKAWQSLRPIGRKKTAVVETVTFSLMQINFTTLPYAFGGSIGESTGIYTLTPAADTAAPDYKAMVIGWEDGSDEYRINIQKTLLTGAVELSLKAEEDILIPCEVSILAPDSGSAWVLVSDDANLDSTP